MFKAIAVWNVFLAYYDCSVLFSEIEEKMQYVVFLATSYDVEMQLNCYGIGGFCVDEI